MSFITRSEPLKRGDAEKNMKVCFSLLGSALCLCVSAVMLSAPVAAQRVTILTPDKADASMKFADVLRERLDDNGVKLLDASLSQMAYTSTPPATPFNLTTDEAKRIGQTIGCDFYILLRAATLRRSSSQRTEYYESFAAVYLVSSRTGRLVFWRNQRFDGYKPETAAKLLDESVGTLANEIGEKMHAALKAEQAEPLPPAIEEPPDPASPLAKNFRAPIPYRRIKPEYTTEASFYDVAATVDIVVDADATGKILRTEITRWAGYGLDESVEKTVRAMNWRPAERNGKHLAMRFLLRYNFKKMDKE